jgi:hypothetical protein
MWALTSIVNIRIHQIDEEASMATQVIVGQDLAQATRNHQYNTATPSAIIGRKWMGLRGMASEVYWKVSFELEPFFQGFFAPFTAVVRGCRLLSHREQSELLALLKKR